MDAERAKIVAALTPVATASGVEIDELHIHKAGGQRILEVVLDCDHGVDLDTVAAVSRAASVALDDLDLMGEVPYVLEVSSRGVGRPLTKDVHWQRNVGRLVTATIDGRDIAGRILSVSDGIAQVSVASGVVDVPLAHVARAVIDVEFNRKEAH